jgi:hypothetical protein
MTDRWRYQCPDGHVTVTTRETLGSLLLWNVQPAVSQKAGCKNREVGSALTVPPQSPVALAADPLCVEPRRTFPVDDGNDAIGTQVRQVAQFPDTTELERRPTTPVHTPIQ